eukprot:9443419-Pyramimonas_sp.AAC.1
MLRHVANRCRDLVGEGGKRDRQMAVVQGLADQAMDIAAKVAGHMEPLAATARELVDAEEFVKAAASQTPRSCGNA